MKFFCLHRFLNIFSLGLSSHHPLHYPLNTRNTISATYTYVAKATSYHVTLAMELLKGLLI
ncbi:V-type proton ATPase catalytic subunit A [Gossypium arboreum]|uniref:V-type proton ATPase catalytic subunit A n=1 Tax=Gossypium arboreum TaxID=29729 RepID=A0A0B0NHP3_GOSAR|nr:V-type proton ATPase catalytic subunit A [Gossypium arboreum]